jgi:hypothetical protein
MAKNPSDVAKKWQRNLAGASESIRLGVNAITESPTEKAARRQDAYISGVQRAAASGKWARGLRRVSAADWQRAMIDKGIQRIASGASTATPKVEQFMGQWLPYMDQLRSKLASMPRGDIEQNKARMIAAVDHAAAFTRQ